MAPLTTTPTIKAVATPVRSAIPTATGARATIVPTDVPTEIEIKQAAIKIPAASKFSGNIANAKFTVASTAPIAFVVCAKAPAITKISTISIKLPLPAPLQYCSIRLFSAPPFENAILTIEAIEKATVIGIL